MSRTMLSVWVILIPMLALSMEYIPRQPDPLSEIYRWKAQPKLNQEVLYTGDTDADGVIWLAGDSRLLAFDGHSVEEFAFPDSWPDMGSGKDLLCSSDGFQYLLYQNGVFRFGREHGFDLLQVVREPDGVSTSFAQTVDGTIWLGIRTGLFRIESKELQKANVELDAIQALEIDAMGHLWVADDQNQIVVFDPDSSDATPLQRVQEITIPSEFRDSTLHLYRKPNGTIWALVAHPSWVVIEFSDKPIVSRIPLPEGFTSAVGFNYSAMPDGRILFSEKSTTAQFFEGQWTPLNLKDYPVATHESFSISLSESQILIGGSHTRRYLIDLSSDRWSTYSDLVFCDEDAHGVQWFLHKDRSVITHDPGTNRWSVWDVGEGLIDSPNSIHCASDGTIWVTGMHEGDAALSYRSGAQWKRQVFPQLGYTLGHLAICELADGRLILGNGSDGFYDSRPGGAVLCQPTTDGFEFRILSEPYMPQRPSCIVLGDDDGVWIGGRNLYHKPDVDATDLSLQDRFQRSWIDHLMVDSNHHLWLANWRLGLFRFDGDQWFEIRDERNQSGIQATFILQGNQQKGVWIATTEGLHRFDGNGWVYNALASDFRFAKEGATLVEGKHDDLWLNFSYRDWFLNSPITQNNRAQIHRSVRYRADHEPPETEFVHVETQLDEPANAFFSWSGQDRWEDTPQNELMYSFRLSGRNWSEYSERTEVALFDLPSGDYTIEVRARDQDLNVDPSPALASFRVLPPLWKRTWFVTVVTFMIGMTLLLVATIIRQRIRYAVALTEFKIDFFTNLSHELRTPLSVILGPLQRLIQHTPSPADRQSLEMIQRNANKMLGLVNQLLEFRKIELGKLEFSPRNGEVIGFVKDALYSLSPLWEQKHQTVDIGLDDRPFRCAFDPDKLIRITDNLLSNAIKYTPEHGRITIRVQVTRHSENTPCLLLKMEDSGVGIPKSKLSRITEPFYTARNDGREKPGSGIGLALVKEMISLWNGTLTIESETKGEQRGTRVTVSLPLLPSDTQSQQESSHVGRAEAEAHDDDLIPTAKAEKRKRILVVEDNLDLRSFLEGELSRYFEVETAEHGLEGIERSMHHPPDLILSDVMMPEMNGIELCRKIRETPEISHIPIILLTARTAEEHYLEGIESGADEYFSKPVSAQKLITRIENLLESRQALYELFAKEVVVEPERIAVLPADQLFLKHAIEIAEANLRTEDFDVEAFAKQMAVSRATLNRKIKAITGISPKAFLRSMRLKRSAHLLASTDLSINEVFFQVGFYDASNFSRVFKKTFHMTPSEYRESHQAPNEP